VVLQQQVALEVRQQMVGRHDADLTRRGSRSG
jgi:hypothetical protein